jgi:hypothetical protein
MRSTRRIVSPAARREKVSSMIRRGSAFSRGDLIASHGADYAMPNLLNHLAAPGCSRLGSHWDRCGVHFVEPIEGGR